MTEPAPRVVFDTIDSTNDEARRRAAAGEIGPLWIAARRQTAGRGRQGRVWSSEPGNLAATYLFAFCGAPAEAARLSFVAALAVADTLSALAPGAEITLKWPNDALANRRKAAGILLENFGTPRSAPRRPAAGRPVGGRAAGRPGAAGNGPATHADRAMLLAIGIGLNLAHHPPPDGAVWPPTSLAKVTGKAPGFADALDELATNLAHRLAQNGAEGFDQIRRHWLARAINLGRQIEVRLPHETLTGRFEDLDTDGALVLQGPTGLRRIAAGDVFFPGGA